MTIVGTSSPKELQPSVVMVDYYRRVNLLVLLAAQQVIALQGFSVLVRQDLIVNHTANVYCLPLDSRVLHLQIARQVIVPHTDKSNNAQSLRSLNHAPSLVNVNPASFVEFPPTRALKIIPGHSMSLL